MEIIRHDKVKAIVTKYKKLEQHIQAVTVAAKDYDLFCKQIKHDELGLQYRIKNIIDDKLSGNKYNFIKEILQFDSLKNLMTHKQRAILSEDLSKLSEKDELQITEAAAHDLLASLHQNADQLIINALKEVYATLTNNKKTWQGDTYKSVESFKVGKKSIIFMGDQTSRANAFLIDTETAFNLCTGQNIRDDFRAPYDAFKNNFETNYTYFEVKYYKNGNIHIIFTDKDAVEELNCKVGKYFNQLQSV